MYVKLPFKIRKKMTDEERLQALIEYADKHPELKSFIAEEYFVAVMKHLIGSHFWLLGI